MSYTRGKCELCDGNVFLPSVWHGIYPPVPSDFCAKCQPPLSQRRHIEWPPRDGEPDMRGVPIPTVDLVGKRLEKP